jgi:hypothetical protein
MGENVPKNDRWWVYPLIYLMLGVFFAIEFFDKIRKKFKA